MTQQDAQPPAAIVEAADLTKSYGTIRALDGVTLAIPSGCTGLLGPNGAGKSTLIKVLLGLLPSDRGSAHILGCDPAREPLRLRSLVGYMPEHPCLPGDWLAQDFVRFMAQLHGLPPREAIQRASDALYSVGLGEERYRPIRGFSTGMKQRVKLAQALVHDPHLMFLDEPTNGLDPVGRDEMLALIRRLTREMGLNVLLSSHLLPDVEDVADYVVILTGGRVALQGPLTSLVQTTPTITVQVYGELAPLAHALQRRGCAAESRDGELRVAFTSDTVYDAIRDAAAETGAILRYLKRRKLSLQDVYLAAQDEGAPVVTAS